MPEKLISIHAFRPAAAIQVSGDDALEFLQGQFTNNLRSPVGSATYGLWLNQKGKVLADSDVFRTAESEFLLTSASSLASVITQRLEQYIIADDVVLDDQTALYGALSLWGQGTAEFLQDLVGGIPTEGLFLENQGVIVFGDHRTGRESFQIIGLHEVVEKFRALFLDQGGTAATESDAEFARIAADIPSVPCDIGPTDLPQEAGLENTAISFTKGCYLGQEVMARLKSMGQVRRQLRRVRGTGAAPVHGTALFQGAKKVGEIRSAVATSDGFVAFAMLTRMGLDENADLTFEIPGARQSAVSLWAK